MNRLNLFDTVDKVLTLNMNKMFTDKYWGDETNPSRLKEESDRYSISLNLAGSKKEDIKISFEENNELLCVVTDGELPYHYRVYIPKEIDAHNTKAQYKNGILSVTIPKSEKSKPVSISID